MHDFHWRNSPYLRLRTIDENGQSVLRVSRSQAERVYVRSSESLSCSFHFSVTLICATLSLFPSSRFPPRCSVFANLLSLSLLFYDRVSFLRILFSFYFLVFSLVRPRTHTRTHSYLHQRQPPLRRQQFHIFFSLFFLFSGTITAERIIERDAKKTSFSFHFTRALHRTRSARPRYARVH